MLQCRKHLTAAALSRLQTFWRQQMHQIFDFAFSLLDRRAGSPMVKYSPAEFDPEGVSVWPDAPGVGRFEVPRDKQDVLGAAKLEQFFPASGRLFLIRVDDCTPLPKWHLNGGMQQIADESGG